MTFEFELKEAVDVSVLKSAWEKTCAVYPMLTYAVAKCEHRYCFTEDKLDFVFRETTERIEPTQDASNYHSTAFGYQGNILHIYIDHTIMGCAGFLRQGINDGLNKIIVFLTAHEDLGKLFSCV